MKTEYKIATADMNGNTIEYIWGPTYKSVAQDFVKSMNEQGISHHKLVHMSEVIE